MKLSKLLFCFALSVGVAGCSVRLVDFTTISSKNVNLGVDRAQGKTTKGSKSYFLGIGWNIKDALDNSLTNAGPEYDMLIDGVVRYGSYFFYSKVTVEGLAVKSSAMRRDLGEVGFEEWLKTHSVFDPTKVARPAK